MIKRHRSMGCGVIIGMAGLLCVSFCTSGCRSGVQGRSLLLPVCVADVPSQLQGPIDETLPTFGTVYYARVCAGTRGRLGIVWVRDVATMDLQWDASAAVWRVRGSEQTLKPGPRLMDGIPSLPRQSDVFAEGELVGMCVLGPNGVERSEFLPGIGPESGHIGDVVGKPAFCNDEWHVPLALWPHRTEGTVLRPRGIAVAAFSERGWSSPRVLLPEIAGMDLCLFEGIGQTDVFWFEYYNLRFDLPDFMGGHERERLQHALVAEGQAPAISAVYHRPNIPHSIWETQSWIVPLGGGRYDLIRRRYTNAGKHATDPEELIHVPNLLGGFGGSGVTIGRPELNSEVAVLALSRQRLQVLWLEEIYDDPASCISRTYRLVETHLGGWLWTRPRAVLADKGPWRYSGFAATTFQAGDEELVLALWPGKEGHLTYTIGSGWHGWSAPVTTDLVIGSPNWVVNCGDGLMLVTRVKNNLYWCRFTVASDSNAPPPAMPPISKQ